MDYEVLDHWWEYFKVLWWAIFPPADNHLLSGRAAPTKEGFEQNYKQKVTALINDTDQKRTQALSDFLKEAKDQEEDRKKTIEGKAHSLIGQTGIAASLLVGSMSLVSSQVLQLQSAVSLMIVFLVFLVVLHFIAAGLHARHALTLRLGYHQQTIDDYLGKPNQVDFMTNLAFGNEYNSYLNEIKGTYLKMAHWLFKCAFALLLLSALTIPPAIVFTRTPKSMDDKQCQAITCRSLRDSCNANHSKIILNDQPKPFLESSKLKIDSLPSKAPRAKKHPSR